MPRDRELLAPPDRPAAGRTAADSARLLARATAVLFIDESHATIPQVRGMYFGDRSRKENLVKYGFRLPSALDNRPLNFQEFEERRRTRSFMFPRRPGPMS